MLSQQAATDAAFERDAVIGMDLIEARTSGDGLDSGEAKFYARSCRLCEGEWRRSIIRLRDTNKCAGPERL